MFNMYVEEVNDCFEEMVRSVFSSDLEFIYVYGENSPGLEERKKYKPIKT